MPSQFASDPNAVITPMTTEELELGLACGIIDIGQINWLIKRALDKVETERAFVNATNMPSTPLINGVFTDVKFEQHRDPSEIYDPATGVITYPFDGFVLQTGAVYFSRDEGASSLPFTSTAAAIRSLGSIDSAYRLGQIDVVGSGALAYTVLSGSIIRPVSQGDTSKVIARQISGETKDIANALSYFQSYYLGIN